MDVSKQRARGFTLPEVVLSITLWGLMMVPFVAFYGQMQRMFYTTHRQVNLVAASRAVTDRLRDDLHRLVDPARVGGTPSATAVCFSYTPVDATTGAALTDRYLSYRWDAASKQLLRRAADASGTLADFCAGSGEEVVAAAGGQAYLTGVTFVYYDATGEVTPTLSPSPNFTRVSATIAFASPAAL